MSDDPAYMNTTASIAKVYPYPPSQGETEGRVPSLSFHLAGEGRATRRLRLRPTTVTTCQNLKHGHWCRRGSPVYINSPHSSYYGELSHIKMHIFSSMALWESLTRPIYPLKPKKKVTPRPAIIVFKTKVPLVSRVRTKARRHAVSEQIAQAPQELTQRETNEKFVPFGIDLIYSFLYSFVSPAIQ